MKIEKTKSIAQKLQTVSEGTLSVERIRSDEHAGAFFSEQFQGNTSGKGSMEFYDVFPGIEASFNSFIAPDVKFHHRASESVLEVYYCRSGRCQGESVSPQEHVRASIYLHSGPCVVDGRSDDVDASLLVEFRCVVSHTVANLLCFYGLRKIFPVSGVVKVSCRAQESPRARQTRRDGVSRRRCARRRMSRTICCPRSCRTCCGHRSRVCGHPSSV